MENMKTNTELHNKAFTVTFTPHDSTVALKPYQRLPEQGLGQDEGHLLQAPVQYHALESHPERTIPLGQLLGNDCEETQRKTLNHGGITHALTSNYTWTNTRTKSL